MRTFYVASSIHNVVQTRQLAEYLVERGFNWACAHDWTRYDGKDAPFDSPNGSLLAAADIMAATSCDLFILLRTNVTSHGAHAELGARIASNKEAHIILQDTEDHLFYYHPLVIRYPTIEDFLHCLKFGKLRDQRDLIPRSPPV